ncbi:type II toxin-antitoxin system RelE/ParE family toxin [uncultured Sulfitobacter sp.]|uniref:type II toxin-antitoxin system RelE/ParE family toxin n=1 Tax=uncultured Sulfitobacter sp. TaxID=191468 RepID=UPI0026104E3D|nr:type II toxin-antitoxin system RelE/ParE family toxin [uncultured Sulfitobacter sp.]
MKYKIRFHPEVADDLQIIAEIVADYSGLSVAKNKLNEIQSAVFSLADTPKKGTIRSELGVAVRAIPAGRKGIVVFEVDENTTTVFVLAITYGGADWISKFEDRQEN